MDTKRLNELINEGRKAGQPEKVQAFQAVLSTVQAEENRGNEVNVTNVIKKEYNKFLEASEAFEKAGREEAVAMKSCADYLKAYLPAEVPQDQYPDIIDEAIRDVGAESMRDMGKVMGELRNQYGISMDMGIASKIVKEKLS